MSLNQTSLASDALVLLGEEKISALAENPQAEALYPDCYRAALSCHPWHFALKSAQLTLKTDAVSDKSGYQYKLSYPDECLRLWAVHPFQARYTIIGRDIYANQRELHAWYVHEVNESILPAYFVSAFKYMLAAEFAMPVTEDEKKADIWTKKGEEAMHRAKAWDSQQAPIPGYQRALARRG